MLSEPQGRGRKADGTPAVSPYLCPYHLNKMTPEPKSTFFRNAPRYVLEKEFMRLLELSRKVNTQAEQVLRMGKFPTGRGENGRL